MLAGENIRNNNCVLKCWELMWNDFHDVVEINNEKKPGVLAYLKLFTNRYVTHAVSS